jgi:hypothetical protein
VVGAAVSWRRRCRCTCRRRAAGVGRVDDDLCHGSIASEETTRAFTKVRPWVTWRRGSPGVVGLPQLARDSTRSSASRIGRSDFEPDECASTC